MPFQLFVHSKLETPGQNKKVGVSKKKKGASEKKKEVHSKLETPGRHSKLETPNVK